MAEDKRKNYRRPEERQAIPWPEEKEGMTLLDRILSYSRSGVYPLHMPGHKRNTDRFGSSLPFSLDMTETYGMADLHQPSGLLEERMKRAAADFSSAATFFSVNGSTSPILASIQCLTRRGDKILFDRRAHQSAWHALELNDLRPVYLLPERDQGLGSYASIDPQEVEKKLEDDPHIKTVFITSPSYEGVISDVASIASCCHRHGARLIVDQAHGAHFHYCRELPEDAILLGADVVVESLHKTLPALTSTALLHISDRVDAREMQRNLAIFETSSPSHLLLASIDECEEYMRREGRAACDRLFASLDKFYRRLEGLQNLSVLGLGRDSLSSHPAIWRRDPGKIIISSRFTPLDGTQLMEALRQRGYELEMACGSYALALATIGDSEEELLDFADSLLTLDQEVDGQEESLPLFPPLPSSQMTIRGALEAERELLPLSQARGRISADYVWAYPPGLPLLAPGELVDQDILDYFSEQEGRHIRLRSSFSRLPSRLSLVRV